MTADRFRSLALALPEAVEAAHMNHPDFRVGGKIFASLASGEKEGMVKLTPEQQSRFQQAADVFYPAAGAWGRRGYTMVRLAKAKVAIVREALRLAWENIGC